MPSPHAAVGPEAELPAMAPGRVVTRVVRVWPGAAVVGVRADPQRRPNCAPDCDACVRKPMKRLQAEGLHGSLELILANVHHVPERTASVDRAGGGVDVDADLEESLVYAREGAKLVVALH